MASDDIEVFMEPILNSNTPKWLIITKTVDSDIMNDPRELKKKLKDPGPPVTHIEFGTTEPNVWRCKTCGKEFQSDQKPTNCLPKDKGGCERATNFERVTSNINKDNWKIPHWKELSTDEINMLDVYHELLDLIKRCIVFPEDKVYEIYTLYIIATYKKEAFSTAPYFMFRGLPESGKSRALDLLWELGYRMVLSTSVTFSALCRLSHFYGAGVLVDEIDNKIDKRTESGREMLDFIKPSYRKGSVYIVSDKEDQTATISYRNFGFKAFAGEEGGRDVALFTRTFDIHMQQGYPEIDDLTDIQEDLDRMQNILLNYRYQFIDPGPLPDDFPFKGRTREIYGPIVRTAVHIGLDPQGIIDYITSVKQDELSEIQETIEYEILKAIFNIQHGIHDETDNGQQALGDDDAPETLSYKQIAERCGWDTDTEEGKKKQQRIGYVFKKKFFLKTKRANNGTVLLLTDEKNITRLRSLYRRYKLR